MLSDNLDFQESIIHDIKDRAKIVLGLFPAADGNKARVKLIALDQRFLLVKERLQRRQEEMLKASVDWHEFECGLKSCLEWVQSACHVTYLKTRLTVHGLRLVNFLFWQRIIFFTSLTFFYRSLPTSFFSYELQETQLGTIFTLNLLLTA